MSHTVNANTDDVLELLNERILQELFRTIMDGNSEECAQIFAKFANKHGDLAIFIFYYYSEIIQEEAKAPTISDKKISLLWTLIKHLEDDFSHSLESLFFGSVIGEIKSSEINQKRKNPFAEENKDEEENKITLLTELYKKSKNCSRIKCLYSSVFQKLSLNFLKLPSLSDNHIEEYLKIFSKKIIPRLENPLLFADYLMVNNISRL